MDTKDTRKDNEHNVVNFVILCELCGQFILYGCGERAETLLKVPNVQACDLALRSGYVKPMRNPDAVKYKEPVIKKSTS